MCIAVLCGNAFTQQARCNRGGQLAMAAPTFLLIYPAFLEPAPWSFSLCLWWNKYYELFIKKKNVFIIFLTFQHEIRKNTEKSSFRTRNNFSVWPTLWFPEDSTNMPYNISSMSGQITTNRWAASNLIRFPTSLNAVCWVWQHARTQSPPV